MKKSILSILMVGSIIFNQEEDYSSEINTTEQNSYSWFPFEVATSCPLYLKEEIEEALNSGEELSQEELRETLYGLLFFTDSVAVELILKLLAKNIDLNILYENGNSFLNKAIDYSKGNYTVVNILLDAGANPNLETDGLTSLDTAIWSNDPRLVQILLDACADPNFRGCMEDSSLEIAIYKNNPEIIQKLIAAGATN